MSVANSRPRVAVVVYAPGMSSQFLRCKNHVTDYECVVAFLFRRAVFANEIDLGYRADRSDRARERYRGAVFSTA